MKITKNLLFGFLVIAIIMVVASFTFPLTKREVKFMPNYKIVNKWTMPDSLNEISGMAWLGNNKLACIEDEDGIIFIYDLKETKIVEKIHFAENGDFEAIALKSEDAFIMRSDGLLFQVKNFQDKNKSVGKFKTAFSSKNNIESLVYDASLDALITIPKHQDLESKESKTIYSLNFSDGIVSLKTIFIINMLDKKLEDFEHKKSRKNFMPSDIAIHPQTGEIYILEGKDSKLVILDKKGSIRKVYPLDDKVFRQPEGITFSENGTLFISNEKNGEPANILEVELVK